MVDENDHNVCVDAWMQRGAEGLKGDQLVRAFEVAFAAVWHRAHTPLGDLLLHAIVERVLYSAAEQYPMFSSLKMEPTGLCFDELREHAGGLHDQLTEGVRFVLVKFLTVLGNLTADVLTSALHAELSKLEPGNT